MDTTLRCSTAALNGFDVLLWVLFVAVVPRLFTWAYRRPAKRTVKVFLPQPAETVTEASQLKLAV